MVKKNNVTSLLWENFEHYLSITIDDVTNKYSLQLLSESDHYSLFPNAWKIWSIVANYCNEYIKNGNPKDFGRFGRGYVINLPEVLIDFSFWEKLQCKIVLIDEKSIDNTVKSSILTQNRYTPKLNESDEEYIRKHGKMESVKLELANVAPINDLINNELRVSFFHEMMHAYEDYSRIIKGADDTLEQYKEKTNYYDTFNNRKTVGEEGWMETNLLKNLFHFFNKTEIRAMASEFSGEILGREETKGLTGILDNTKEIIESTLAWKKIEDAEEVVNILNSVNDATLQNELLSIYNKHLVRGQVKTYDAMLKMINRHFWYVKQEMFKKFSKIMRDIYNNNNKHISI